MLIFNDLRIMVLFYNSREPSLNMDSLNEEGLCLQDLPGIISPEAIACT
jgi:hypothetical protein